MNQNKPLLLLLITILIFYLLLNLPYTHLPTINKCLLNNQILSSSPFQDNLEEDNNQPLHNNQHSQNKGTLEQTSICAFCAERGAKLMVLQNKGYLVRSSHNFTVLKINDLNIVNDNLLKCEEYLQFVNYLEQSESETIILDQKLLTMMVKSHVDAKTMEQQHEHVIEPKYNRFIIYAVIPKHSQNSKMHGKAQQQQQQQSISILYVDSRGMLNVYTSMMFLSLGVLMALLMMLVMKVQFIANASRNVITFVGLTLLMLGLHGYLYKNNNGGSESTIFLLMARVWFICLCLQRMDMPNVVLFIAVITGFFTKIGSFIHCMFLLSIWALLLIKGYTNKKCNQASYRYITIILTIIILAHFIRQQYHYHYVNDVIFIIIQHVSLSVGAFFYLYLRSINASEEDYASKGMQKVGAHELQEEV